MSIFLIQVVCGWDDIIVIVVIVDINRVVAVAFVETTVLS